MYRSCIRSEENCIKQNHQCVALFPTTFRTLVAFLFCDRHKGTKSVLEKRWFCGFLSTSPAIHGNYIRKLLMNRPFLTECNTENFHVTFRECTPSSTGWEVRVRNITNVYFSPPSL